MKNFPMFVANDIERSLVFTRKNGHVDVAVLVEAGDDDPAYLNIAEYEDERDDPISEIKMSAQEFNSARKLLNDPLSLRILGIDS